MEVKTIIQNTSNLPATPQILPKIQRLINEENTSIEQIIMLIRMDAPLLAQVLKLSNSAYFGSSTPVDSIEDAVSRIGFREVLKLVTMIASQQLLSEPAVIYGMNQGAMWKTSLYNAVIMETATQDFEGYDPNQAYTIGLLHNIGKAILNKYLLQHHIELYENRDNPITPEEEVAVVGMTNADVAYGTLMEWAFPPSIAVPILHQYNPSEADGDHNRHFAHLLVITKNITRQLMEADNYLTVEIDSNIQGLEEIGMTFDILCACVQRAKAAIATTAQMFGLED